MQYKTCSKCGEVKELECYYNAKRGKYGKDAHCIVCDKAKQELNKERSAARYRERYAEDPEFFLQKARDYVAKNKEKVAQKNSERHKKKRLENPAAARLKDAENRAKNADKIREYQQRYVDKNIEEIIKKRKDSYLADREENIKKSARWHRENPEKSRAIKRAWAVRNPDKVAMSRLRRRKIKAQCVPAWAKDEWDSFIVKEVCHLAKLRTILTGFSWHVDHKVPLVSELVCGLHCAANLQAIPATENLSKSNLKWEYMP